MLILHLFWLFLLCERFFIDCLYGSLLLVNRWRAPSKFDPVKSPMLFFEKNQPLIPPVLPAVGLDKVLKHVVQSPSAFSFHVIFKLP